MVAWTCLIGCIAASLLLCSRSHFHGGISCLLQSFVRNPILLHKNSSMLHIPRYHLHYTSTYASKLCSYLFSRPLTTRFYHTSYAYNELIPSNNRPLTPIEIDNKSIAVNLDNLTQLQQNGSFSSPYVVNKLVSLCANSGSFHSGIQIHSAIVKMGFHSNLYISTALVDMYGKCGVVSCAQRLFDEMPQRNVVTWNSLISGYLHMQNADVAVGLFMEMVKLGIGLTPFSVSEILVGCAQLEALDLGAQVHCLSIKIGFVSNVVVGTGLIDMYSKCLKVDDSRRIFDIMSDKNVITWTVMVTGYVQNKKSDEAMHLVREMLSLGIAANNVTYNSLLSSFSHRGDLNNCKQVHSQIIKEGLEFDAYLAVTMVTIYSECGGNLADFYKLCSCITIWDQISWNAVIAGFSNLASSEEALLCFFRMRQVGINADYFTFTSVLRAMGVTSALKEGLQTHALVLKSGYEFNICVQNGLVSMYARCGRMDQAKKVFLSMAERDLISWNSLLSGYANHGYGSEAVEMFEQMRKITIKPDLSTYLSVLSACSHVGLLKKGLEYFDLMRNYPKLEPPKIEHYACIVDLYGRAGYLNEAEAFIDNMPLEPGSSVFKALLSACQVHGNKEIAGRAARKLVELCPDDPATYVLLSNVLANAGFWDDSAGVRKLMGNIGVKKHPGYSWI